MKNSFFLMQSNYKIQIAIVKQYITTIIDISVINLSGEGEIVGALPM